MVRQRRQQMDTLYAAQGRSSADFWARRAAAYAANLRLHPGQPDGFLRTVLQFTDPASTVLDVGAGTGRYAVPLAGQVRKVLAVDPSLAMLEQLTLYARQEGVANIEVVEGTWPQVEVGAADVVLCAHVLYPIEEVVPFLQALWEHARRAVFLAAMVDQVELFDGFQELHTRFHGEARKPHPTYTDALNVLHQLGIFANAGIERQEGRWTYDSVEDAVEWQRESLIAPETAAARRAIRAVVEPFLELLPDGRWLWRRQRRVATIWWTTGEG